MGHSPKQRECGHQGTDMVQKPEAGDRWDQ